MNESDLVQENLVLKRILERETLANMTLRDEKIRLAERCRLLESQIDLATHRIKCLIANLTSDDEVAL